MSYSDVLVFWYPSRTNIVFYMFFPMPSQIKSIKKQLVFWPQRVDYLNIHCLRQSYSSKLSAPKERWAVRASAWNWIERDLELQHFGTWSWLSQTWQDSKANHSAAPLPWRQLGRHRSIHEASQSPMPSAQKGLTCTSCTSKAFHIPVYWRAKIDQWDLLWSIHVASKLKLVERISRIYEQANCQELNWD